MESNTPNPSENSNETTPPPPSTNHHLRRHGVTYPSRSRGDDSQEPYYFLSEPSISEEGSSSQYTGTPLSPMNGADITMVNSPSNTSLSSLGSPGGTGSVHRKVMMIRKKAYFTKNPIGQFESSLCPTEEVLSSSLEEPEIKNDKEKVEREEEAEKKKTLASENIDECIKNLSSGTECNDKSEMSHHSKDGVKVESSTGDGRVSPGSADATSQFKTFSKKSFEVVNDKTAQTPESARYHTAVESPDNEDDEDDNSISSYEESSSDEEPVASKTLGLSGQNSPDMANKPHYLNEPLITAEQVQNAEEEGKMALLGDATVDDEHLQVMDMSSILPESKISPPMDPSLFETPPTRNTAVDDNILPNESVTPKRKTISRQSSIESLGIVDLTSQLDILENNGEINAGEINAGESKTEQKKDTPRKANISATEKRNKHRRKRSGDIVAASIYAGSADWAGMELDKIPLPEQRGIDDDMEFFDDAPNFFIDSRSRSKKVLETTNSGSSSEINLPAKIDDVSTRFSPRVTRSDHEGYRTRNKSVHEEPFLRKNYSFGDRSASTHDSESNFSWISHRTFQTKETANGREYAQDNIGDSSQTGDTSGLSNIAPFYSSDKDGQFHPQPLINNRSVPVKNERSDSPGPAPPPLERHAGIENEIKHFQSRVHVRSKSDNSSYNSVASAKSVSSIEIEEDVYPTYICPRCSTKQREFFTVASVHKDSKGGSGGWMVVIFITYMVGALFLFGWEVCFISFLSIQFPPCTYSLPFYLLVKHDRRDGQNWTAYTSL
jgi:hypothetical protein